MALKLRGSSQVKDSSITLSRIEKLQSGKILGRAVDTEYTGKPLDPNNPESIIELGAEDVRRISGLWEEDSPVLNGLNLLKFNDLGGNLSVQGIANIDGDFFVNNDKFKISSLSGNVETLGSMTAKDDIKLNDGTEDMHHLNSNGELTSKGKIKSKSSFEVVKIEGETATSKFSVDNDGNLIAAGTGTFTSDVISGDATGTHVKLEASSGKVISKLLEVGGLDGDNNPAKLIVDGNGNVSINKDLSVSGTLDVGDINVSGSVTQIDTEHLHVRDSLIMLADGNTADLLDIGFIGKSSAGHHGLVRDSDDSIFKLFQNSSEDLSSDNSVDFTNGDLEYGHLYLNKITLQGTGSAFVGDLTGNADTATQLETSRDFSIGTSAGDTGDITAAVVSFDGSANVELSATINSGAVDFAHLNDAAVVTSTETLLASADSDVTIPTSKAVAAYVESKVSSGGFANVANMDLQMGYVETVEGVTTESFVRVYETVVYHTVADNSGHSEQDNQQVLVNLADESLSHPEFDSKLDDKIMVFVNGQKLRIGTAAEVSAGTADFSIESRTLQDSSTSRDVIQFKTNIVGGVQQEDTIANDDELEIRYYNKY